MRSTQKKLSLNKRIGLIAAAVLVPMMLLIAYLLYVMNATNESYDEVSDSVTYANRYAMEFKERMDYSVYLAIIRGQKANELKEGEVTVNGVEIVSPYKYINELRKACEEMARIATVRSNKNLPNRIENTLNSLKKRIQEIDKNMDNPESYNQNMDLLDNNIRSLTGLIEEGIRNYIDAENASLALVKEEMMQKSSEALRVCGVTVFVMFVVTIILSVLASRSVTRPIQKLCDMAKLVGKGDFTARTDVEAEDEVAMLTDSFNDMTLKIGQLVNDIKEEQANLRFTESRLLQAQINPHFLYNTLDTIVWMAEQKQTEDVVSMVTSLSDFFRTTLSKGRDYITVEEERKHVESYLEIQHFRYQDILDYEIDIQPEINKYTIPKLTLQPLVENALYHGIKNKRGRGKITIVGSRKGNKIIFKVIDNGKGMSEEKLNQLRRHIAGDGQSDGNGFGLNNVNQRIKYYYGDEYGVFFESTENEGTEAVIIIPAKNITPLS